MADQVADCRGLLRRQHFAFPHNKHNGRLAAGLHVLQDIGLVLPRSNGDESLLYAGEVSDNSSQPLLQGNLQVGISLCIGGGQPRFLEVRIIEVALLGVTGLHQPGHHHVLLVRPDIDGISLQAVVREAVLLQIIYNRAGLRTGEIGKERRVGLVIGHDHQHRNEGHNCHHHGTQYDAHLCAHIFEEVLDLFPKLLQLRRIHAESLRPLISNDVSTRTVLMR